MTVLYGLSVVVYTSLFEPHLLLNGYIFWAHVLITGIAMSLIGTISSAWMRFDSEHIAGKVVEIPQTLIPADEVLDDR